MKKLTMMLLQTLALALVAAPFAAAGKDCITDVMVVGGADKSVTNSYASQGWKVIPQDLNAGAGGDWIFLLYKAADSASVSNGFITGFYIKTGDVINELTHAGRGFHLAPYAGDEYFVGRRGDLNSHVGGDNIHLYYTKAPLSGNRVVTGITFNDNEFGAVGKNGGTTGYNLNSGAQDGGNHVYMHVSTTALPYAPGVSYLDPTDPDNPEKVRYGCTLMSGQTTLSSGWYVVAGAVTNDSRIYVSGDVNLILTDGAELTANGGINVDVNDSITNRLTIWAQSTNAVAGKLTARGGDYQAGIGGGDVGAGGEVTINGGTVEAQGGYHGAGIGGGYDGAGGEVTINDGTVKAYGGIGGAGIGGGNHGAGGEVTINGGMVEAHGGECGAGIGGGDVGAGGEVTVNGGKVEAQGGTDGAGIGGGWKGAGGTVTINGGEVTAKGGEDCAAIGAGKYVANDGLLSIDGMRVGYVEADGKVHEWAECGDRDGYCRNRESKTVRIEVCSTHVFEGATCKICGDKARYLDPTDPANPEKVCQDFTVMTNQTALSSGWYVVTGTVTIDSRIYVSGDVNLILCDRAELTANGGINVDVDNNITNSLTIWAQSTNAVAGKLTARGVNWQAGIGGGDGGAGGTVTVNGGKVTAQGGGGAGIGGGWDGAGGEVTINGGTVEAHGGECGAGIGGGGCGAGGEVTVNGGTVEATGAGGGAGIGGGYGGEGGTFTQSGGTVRVTGDTWYHDVGGWISAGSGANTLTGGSLRLLKGNDSISLTPSNGAERVWCVTVGNLTAGARVTLGDWQGTSGYGVDDIYADESGSIYLWLPNGTYRFTANGHGYSAKVKDSHTTVGLDFTAEFGETEYEVDEGGTLEVVVKGGNATMPSRVAVNLSYLTAAAADLDLKNGAVDGVTPKGGLKFPLLLTWDAGDKAPKTISIPVKADKTVEGYETFVLQLAEFVGMGPGETVTAWATIADRNEKTLKPTVSPYKPKKGESVATNEVTVGVSPSDLGFAAGSGAYTAGTKLTMVAEARPGCAFVGWERNGSIESDKPKYQIVVSNDCSYTARFAGTDYMTALADPADGGKVTGSGFCPAGKKVTLKAAANKGFAFLGWRRAYPSGLAATSPVSGEEPEDSPSKIEGVPEGRGSMTVPGDYMATTATLVIDRTAKPAKDTKTSTTLTNITSSATFYAVFESDPLVSAIPVEAEGETPKGVNYDAGKVTGVGRYAPGKKVTLKATANKGFAFSGFFDAEGNLLDETRSASLSFEMGATDVPLTARFVTVDADKGSIAANVDGWELEPWVSKTETHAFATNVWAGVSLAWPLAASALSQTTVKVAGLPAGLKFTAKDILKKGSKTEVDVPANTIYGAPTAASKTDKDGNPVPSTVKVTVTTAGKSSATYEIDLTVNPLPDWAVGTFDGVMGNGGWGTGNGESASAEATADERGTASLTVAANGKISGKLLRDDGTWTLAADSFASYDAENDVYLATVIGKNGKLLETNEVTVAAIGVSGTTASEPSLSWTAYQNLWKRADTKADMPVIKKDIKVDHWLGEQGDANNKLTLTFKKDGAVSFAGTVDGNKVSGSSQLVRLAEDGSSCQVTLYAPPKPAAKPPVESWCKTFTVTLTFDDQGFVRDVAVE